MDHLKKSLGNKFLTTGQLSNDPPAYATVPLELTKKWAFVG